MVEAAVGFSGTPDQVYAQIVEFARHVGGLGNLMIMGQGGDLSHADTIANLTLFGEEVLPRLEALDQSEWLADARELVETRRAAAA
jgi:alkanesulfonate monooxygenase SsuD/methylene tetrahydromethanopterin reductase-like flavin-dependent oxidoreductase (luciferase family)